MLTTHAMMFLTFMSMRKGWHDKRSSTVTCAMILIAHFSRIVITSVLV